MGKLTITGPDTKPIYVPVHDSGELFLMSGHPLTLQNWRIEIVDMLYSLQRGGGYIPLTCVERAMNAWPEDYALHRNTLSVAMEIVQEEYLKEERARGDQP